MRTEVRKRPGGCDDRTRKEGGKNSKISSFYHYFLMSMSSPISWNCISGCCGRWSTARYPWICSVYIQTYRKWNQLLHEDINTTCELALTPPLQGLPTPFCLNLFLFFKFTEVMGAFCARCDCFAAFISSIQTWWHYNLMEKPTTYSSRASKLLLLFFFQLSKQLGHIPGPLSYCRELQLQQDNSKLLLIFNVNSQQIKPRARFFWF